MIQAHIQRAVVQIAIYIVMTGMYAMEYIGGK